MAAVNIRDTGRNSARTGDVRGLADRVETTNPGQQVTEADVTVTTGTIAVTDDTNTDARTMSSTLSINFLFMF